MRRRVIAIFMATTLMLVLSACAGDTAPPAASNEVNTPAPVSTDELENEPVKVASEDEVVTLNYAHANPEGSMMSDLYNYFAEEVTKESNGSIQFVIHGGATLVTPDQFYEALTTNRVDMTECAPSYFAPFIEELNCFTIPGVFNADDIEEVCAVMKGPADALFQNHGIKVLASSATGPDWLVGSSVIQDPKTDFQGKMIRVSGQANGDAVEIWGGSPVNIPIGDLPTALERKTVDQALTSWPMIDSMKMYESAPHVTLTNIMEPYCAQLMNLEVWNSLSQAQQEAFDRAAGSFERKLFETIEQRIAELIQIFDENGVEYREGTAEDFTFFNEKAMELLDTKYHYESEEAQIIVDAIKSLNQ